MKILNKLKDNIFYQISSKVKDEVWMQTCDGGTWNLIQDKTQYQVNKYYFLSYERNKIIRGIWN